MDACQFTDEDESVTDQSHDHMDASRPSSVKEGSVEDAKSDRGSRASVGSRGSRVSVKDTGSRPASRPASPEGHSPRPSPAAGLGSRPGSARSERSRPEGEGSPPTSAVGEGSRPSSTQSKGSRSVSVIGEGSQPPSARSQGSRPTSASSSIGQGSVAAGSRSLLAAPAAETAIQDSAGNTEESIAEVEKSSPRKEEEPKPSEVEDIGSHSQPQSRAGSVPSIKQDNQSRKGSTSSGDLSLGGSRGSLKSETDRNQLSVGLGLSHSLARPKSSRSRPGSRTPSSLSRVGSANSGQKQESDQEILANAEPESRPSDEDDNAKEPIDDQPDRIAPDESEAEKASLLGDQERVEGGRCEYLCTTNYPLTRHPSR